MRGVIRVPASLELERHSQSSLSILVLHDDLYCSVNVSFQSIGWRPHMLFNIEKLGDGHADLLPVTIACEGVRSRLRLDERLGPGLQFWHLASQVFKCLASAFVTELKQFLEELAERGLGKLVQPLGVPFVSLQGLLEYFMQDAAVYVRLVSGASSLDSVLKHGATDTFEGIGNNSGGYEMVRMNNEEVVRVVDCDLTGGCESITDDVDV